MSSSRRRFEVLLPLQFNDGRDVPTEWLSEAVLEIEDHFAAASYETQKLEGHWRQGGVLYRDNLVRVGWTCPTPTKAAYGCGNSRTAGGFVCSRWNSGW